MLKTTTIQNIKTHSTQSNTENHSLLFYKHNRNFIYTTYIICSVYTVAQQGRHCYVLFKIYKVMSIYYKYQNTYNALFNHSYNYEWIISIRWMSSHSFPFFKNLNYAIVEILLFTWGSTNTVLQYPSLIYKNCNKIADRQTNRQKFILSANFATTQF